MWSPSGTASWGTRAGIFSQTRAYPNGTATDGYYSEGSLIDSYHYGSSAQQVYTGGNYNGHVTNSLRAPNMCGIFKSIPTDYSSWASACSLP